VAENVISRKEDQWKAVCTVPDVCKTPMGGSTPPVPYQVTAEMNIAKGVSGDVHANDHMVHKDDKTIMPKTEGDEPGTAKGVKSGTVGEQAWNVEKSSNVNVNGEEVVRKDDKVEMNGPKLTKEEEEKKKRYECRKEQIEEGKKSNDPATRAAAERFAKNNVAAERAALSGHTYDPSKPPPTGWRDISGDPEALKRYGITPESLDDSRPGATRLYEPNPDVFGNDMRPTLAFRGTENGADWGQNFRQGLNFDSAYYRNAVGLGNTLGNSVDYTGHSLGGGLASAAATAGGGTGTTFNAAGLHGSTVGRYGGQVRPTNIDAYRVDGEVLTGAQEQSWGGTASAAAIGWRIGGLWGAIGGALGKVGIAAAAPNAVGTPHTLPATSGDPVSRHLMPDVQKGIEKQKAEDQKKIAEKTGKKC
jgi:hypothetical protein